MATSRAILMTIGQLSFYDQIKQTLISSGIAEDNLQTHFASSISAVSEETRKSVFWIYVWFGHMYIMISSEFP